jgi:hypothetical protein
LFYDTCPKIPPYIVDYSSTTTPSPAPSQPAAQPADIVDYPWLEYGAGTEELQHYTNLVLADYEMPLIGTDGVLGPETCGALAWLRDQDEPGIYAPDTCQSFNYPRAAPVVTERPPDWPTPGAARAGFGMGGWVLLASAVAAGGVYLATRRKGSRR